MGHNLQLIHFKSHQIIHAQKNQNFVLLLQVPCSILAPLFSLNTLVTRSGYPPDPEKSGSGLLYLYPALQ